MKTFLKIIILLFTIFTSYYFISCYKSKQPPFQKRTFSFNSTSNNLSPLIEEVAKKDTFVFRIHRSLPEYKFILSIDELNFINEIQVYNADDTILIQKILTDSLSIYKQKPLDSDQYFFAKDFNFDGFKDIVLLEYASSNEGYGVWIYNKSKKIFESNDFFIRMDRPTLNRKKKEITTYYKYGGADEYLFETYKLINNKFILIYEVKYWRDWKGDYYIPMKDSSIKYGDSLKLVSRKVAEY